MADVLDYEPKQASTGSPWFIVVNLVLIALAAWPFVQPQIISPHGVTDNDLRFSKFEEAVAFAASYVLTRGRNRAFRMAGWILFAPLALLAATITCAVIGVAIGRE